MSDNKSRILPPWKALGRATALVLLCAAIFLAAVLVVIPRLSGSAGYAVLSNSMAPRYAPGTFLVVEPTPIESFEVGDIVTYQITSGEPDLVTHRVVGFGTGQAGQTALLTKGDNNSATDENLVEAVQVRGKLLYAVPWVGHLTHFAGSARANLVPVAVAGLLAYGVVMMALGTRGLRHRQGAGYSARSRHVAAR